MVRLTFVAALATISTVFSVETPDASQAELFTIELGPGVTKVVTEAEKLALRLDGKSFIDITHHPNLSHSASVKRAGNASTVAYPSSMAHTSAVNDLITKLNKDNMQGRLTTFTEFWTRFYNTTHAKEASDWLLSEIQQTLSESEAAGASVKPFKHKWSQDSLIATIPGKSTDKVIVGAHIDSINGDGWEARSPGADDDGSGTMTILEAMRVLLTDPKIAAGEAENTLEFHWYSGEEMGLLGSADIFDAYASEKVVVKAMLEQDMTGYGDNPMGVIADFVDQGLTEFIRKVITTYATTGYEDARCGHACSDHASAMAAGYPAAFVLESVPRLDNRHIHSAGDTLDLVSYDRMLEHGKLVLGYAYELAFASL